MNTASWLPSRQPDKAEIADFFRLVAASECLMSELAAFRRSEEEVVLLEVISRRFGNLRSDKLSEENKALEYRVLNRTFHGQIHKMAHSPSLDRFASGL